MRRALLCVALLAAVGCGAGETTGEPTAERSGEPAANLDCAFPLVWNEVRYVAGVGLPATSELGPSLGPGVVLGCGSEELGYYPDEDVDVRSVQGVDPAVAVAAVLDDPSEPHVWLAPGYLVESPRHPLHEPIAESWGLDGFEDFACEETFTTRARALSTLGPGQGLEIEAEDPSVESLLVAPGAHRSVALDSGTAISGLERHGAPYVEEGDELVLEVSACEAENDPTLGGPLLLAERLSEG
jgi:hypothetical protein